MYDTRSPPLTSGQGDCAGATFEDLTRQPEPPPSAHVAAQLRTTIKASDWVASLPRWIAKSRTCFGAFLCSTMKPFSRSGTCPPSATFPLPLPYEDVFSGSGPHLPRDRWRRLRRRRLVHVLVVALNFLHGGHAWTPVSLLRRQPNGHQRLVYTRLERFAVACDGRQGEFALPPGRSGPDLLARILELEAFAASACWQDSHGYLKLPSQQPHGFTVPHSACNEELPELSPYRPLDTSRLRLTGQGQWDLAEWLEGPLWLPYQDPLILRHGAAVDPSVVPSFELEDREENLRLARLWDTKGLLHLRIGSVDDAFRCRVFNCYKDPSRDRQIGDRRLVNGGELRLSGPSARLPCAALLSTLRVPRYTHHAIAYITDRKDFYHQMKVSDRRAESNSLAFAFTFDEIKDTRAFGQIQAPRSILHDATFVPSFASLYQGDHLGVEFALEGHKQFLEHAGVIKDWALLSGRGCLPFGDTWQALFIDDLVGITVAPRKRQPVVTQAEVCYSRATAAYLKHGILGSEEKDVKGESVFTAIGGEIVSDEFAVRSGLVTAAAPFARRLPLAALSLRVAALPCITPNLSSKLAGAWVSAALFRRCTMVVFSEIFALARPAAQPGNLGVPLTRRAAQELVLASALMPLMSADLGADYAPSVFATDASLSKGAVCEATVGADVSRLLWEGGDRKAANVKLEGAASALLRCAGFPSDEDVTDPWQTEGDKDRLQKSIPFVIDVLLVGIPCQSVFDEARRYRLRCGPAINVKTSPHFDVLDPSLCTWVHSVLRAGNIRSLLLIPPRSVSRDGKGFDGGLHSGLRLRQKLLSRHLLFLRWAHALGTPAILLHRDGPHLSSLSHWASTANRSGMHRRSLCTCVFGSTRPRQIVALGCHCDFEILRKDCLCSRGSDIFQRRVNCERGGTQDLLLCHGLACEIVRMLSSALDVTSIALQPDRPGLESLLVNDVLLTAHWSVVSTMRWQNHAHINALELGALGAFARHAAVSHPDSRVVALVDSQVAKQASMKGRSSSFTLTPGLRRLAALQLAFGLYFVLSFAPTRLNIADDPSRSEPLRPSGGCSLMDFLPSVVLHRVASLRMRRPHASWGRLFILLSWKGNILRTMYPALAGCFAPALSVNEGGKCVDFDSTLGFPGEGPVFLLWLFELWLVPRLGRLLCSTWRLWSSLSLLSFIAVTTFALFGFPSDPVDGFVIPPGLRAPRRSWPQPVEQTDVVHTEAFVHLLHIPGSSPAPVGLSPIPVGGLVFPPGHQAPRRSWHRPVELIALVHNEAFNHYLHISGTGPVLPGLSPFLLAGLVFPPGHQAPRRSWPRPVELCALFLEKASYCVLVCCFSLSAFDSSRGFPGEGWFRVFWVSLFASVAMAAPVPSTAAEKARAERRRPLSLIADRVVRPVTRDNRAKLTTAFDEWLREIRNTNLEALLGLGPLGAETVADALVAYGKALFRAGHPYYKYSETINAVASLRPSIRRGLGYAWDLAFAWMAEEPHVHHRAIPKGVLLALLSLALAWGWVVEAAVFALSWCGLLRIGEAVAAERRDLVLPCDASPGTPFALLTIRSPKTRGRAARHQSARIDPPDVIQLLSLAFRGLRPGEKLWNGSSETLRRRLNTLQLRLDLVEQGKPCFDLSSFRPGGATWMIQATENSELVRRRGRWLSTRVMDIYLQEVVATTFIPALDPRKRSVLEGLSAAFTDVLSWATYFEQCSIPRRSWFFLLAADNDAFAG